MNGAWEDSRLIQAAESPVNNTRLSVSTNIVPSLAVGNTTETSLAYLSSVVIYQQKNASFVMMNTDPDTQNVISQGVNPVNPNLFNLFLGGLSTVDSSTGGGFSCIYNCQSPSVQRGADFTPAPSQLYVQCFIAERLDPPPSPVITGRGWTYNQSGPGNGQYTFDGPEPSKTLRFRKFLMAARLIRSIRCY